jgi:RIO kinase 2
MAISADDIRTLHRYEIRILLAIERLMKRYHWVPLDEIKQSIGLSESETMFRLGQLMEKGMVRFDAVPYPGYSLVFGGYDALALSTLTNRGTILALGSIIGEGKESVVYEALGLGPVALKFHHVGQRSFQSVRVTREYLPDEGHCPWIFASRYSAEREYEALKTLHPAVTVPLPIDLNRHVVVMEYIPGATLNRCRVEDPPAILGTILENVRQAYNKGIVHNDLSEYNVMLDEDGRVYLIDWPQWIETEHVNAREVLMRDLENLLRYFKRKYKVEYDIGDAMECVTG